MNMKRKLKFSLLLLMMLFLVTAGVGPSGAQVLIQCPGDLNSDAVPDPFLLRPNGTPGNRPNPDYDPNVVCIHLAAGDGFVTMADGKFQYTFGFSDLTGIHQDHAMMEGMLKAELPAPTITVKEGQKVYLTLTNVGMMKRPDLFDPHSVHWHGFPNASTIFDGEPMASISINMGSSLTYFYNVAEPGTFMYHCHVEATEHMQMGMLGNLYVTPAQDGSLFGTCASMKYAYNDGNGSTCYDVSYPIQIHAFDPNFHDASYSVQPLPFAELHDRYGMLNGRGYPETVNTAVLSTADPDDEMMVVPSQKINSLITATAGQKILLRISNLSFDYYTLTVLGIPMKVVGKDAKLLRGPSGLDLSYMTNSVDLGGGETTDVILDTAGVSQGTYFLYTTNLNYLSNDQQELGGMMTEIVIN